MDQRDETKSILMLEYIIQVRLQDIAKCIREWDYVDEDLEKLQKQYWRAKMREESFNDVFPKMPKSNIAGDLVNLLFGKGVSQMLRDIMSGE